MGDVDVAMSTLGGLATALRAGQAQFDSNMGLAMIEQLSAAVLNLRNVTSTSNDKPETVAVTIDGKHRR